MPSAPAISVAMSVYNGERFLDAAIESIRAQTLSNFEFLILDDGSADSSREIIARHANQDSRIKSILRGNRGLVASLNQLLAVTSAPLVARMDADDVALPERFARQAAFLAAHPDHGVVGSWTIDIDEHDHVLAHASQIPDHPCTHDQVLANIETGGPLLAHPTVMYRRDVVLAAGGYHAAFRHCEDYDLWLRLANRTRMANLPERLLRYRRSAGQVSNRHALEQQYGVAVARIAHRERAAGRPDPTGSLERLPPLDRLDALFGIAGIEREVRGTVARALLYSRDALRGPAFEMLIQHVREGGRGLELWRAVPRLLVHFGEPERALRLARALASA